MLVLLQTRSSARWAKVGALLFEDRTCQDAFNTHGHMKKLFATFFWSQESELQRPGAGTFGRVLECWDRKNKSYCAIKIVRNVEKYRDAAIIEVTNPCLPKMQTTKSVLNFKSATAIKALIQTEAAIDCIWRHGAD